MSKSDDSAKTSPPRQASTQMVVRPKEAPVEPRLLPPYRLLLHNDDVNTMDDVVRAIVKITTISTPDAIRKMLDAHRDGVSILLTTHKERGELYVEQFASVRISTTLEPES
jgi:ATP-dependent Clp protease adaptor protein ClpS